MPSQVRLHSILQYFDSYFDEIGILQAWLEEHGPFEVVIDGANVACFGQNHEQGGFQFSQIADVVDRLSNDKPDRKVLVVNPWWKMVV